MDDTGLHAKYLVFKQNGEALDGPCIVLRPDRDPAAWLALIYYAEQIAPTMPRFADELTTWLIRMGRPPEKPAAPPGDAGPEVCRECGGTFLNGETRVFDVVRLDGDYPGTRLCGGCADDYGHDGDVVSLVLVSV